MSGRMVSASRVPTMRRGASLGDLLAWEVSWGAVSMVIEVLEILSLAARGTWRLGFWRPSPRRGL